MDAPCKIQGSIHVFRLVNNMCPGKWVHIKFGYILFLIMQLLYNLWNTQELHTFGIKEFQLNV